MTLSIGLIGDFSPDVAAHIAIPKALKLAADDLSIEIETVWLLTESITKNLEHLSFFHGLWCVPASPYVDMEGALAAIQFAREQGRPFLGTCGGFQHAIIEYVRNVLGYVEADHAESNPEAAMPLIGLLSCSLVEVEDAITLNENSRISHIYGKNEIMERFHCNYGINADYQSLFESGDLKVTGVDNQNSPRVVELSGHPFFIATLFQPERSASLGIVHPLIRAYAQAAVNFKKGIE